MNPLHSLLARQLKRQFGSVENAPADLQAFLHLVDEAYRSFDSDREMLERSLELSSRELLHANADVRAMLQAFPDLILRMRADGTILDCKTSAENAPPFNKPEQLVGKRIQELPLPELASAFDGALPRVRESGSMVKIEYGMPAGDRQIYCEARLVPFIDDQIVAIVRDVTDRRVAENQLLRARDELETKVHERTEELTRTNASLQQSEERVRTILNSVQTGILIIDPATRRIVDANPVALELMGASHADVVGHRCHNRVCAAAEGECPFLDFRRKNLLAEDQMLRRDGSTVQVLKTVVEVNIGGKPMLLESFIDISDRIRAEHDLERAKEAAEAANRAKSDFLASMSHELRTPLSAVIGFADLLQEKALGDLTPKQEEYLQIIADSGRHLLALINEILDLAKVESGRMPMEHAPVSITRLVEQSMSMFKETCLKHNITQMMSVDEMAKGIIAPVDERKVKQVLFNLLSNAVKFTPDGGRVGVEISLIPQPGPSDPPSPYRLASSRLPAVLISVTDTGSGITPEYHDKVFEAFFQIRGGITDKTPGTGLGLALVKQMVAMHGGAVWVESEGQGKGCAFRFTLPLALEYPPAPQDSSNKPAASPRTFSHARINELVEAYRGSIGTFSLGRLRPASPGVQIKQEDVLRELDLAMRGGDYAIADLQGNFVMVLRADTEAARCACRRISARLESRLGIAWTYTVAACPIDGGTAEELTRALARHEETSP